MNVFTLSNGVRVSMEKLEHLRSISVGFWVGAGCYAEDETNNGISHFIEHMLFKGTFNRSAKEIASCIDALGGQLNAFTAKECTCYYVNILSEHYGIAIDLLSDMLLNAKEIYVTYYNEECRDDYIKNIVKIFGKSGFDSFRREKNMMFIPLSSVDTLTDEMKDDEIDWEVSWGDKGKIEVI